MAARTGTASQIDGSAASGSTSVTVPADATGVVAFWSHWDGDGGTTLSTLTLNGVTFLPADAEQSEGAVSNEPGVGVAFLASPATGTQTLAWAWSGGGARSEGGEIVLVYVNAIHATTPVRDAGVDSNTTSGNVTVTVDSTTTDLVLAFAQAFGPGSPALDGTVFINNASVNSHGYDVSEVTAGASTTAVNMTGEDYSSMAVISLQTEAAGGAATIRLRRLSTLGVG